MTNLICDVIENIDLMKKSILCRAFHGELSTNNPYKESALELLKEVLRERVGLT
ncbi:Type I restriction-modification system, specificity subunit S [Desulfosporosinus sp. I2]|nr:Type I restriction-modification system, specificity subunit S [Desulfosporosinus sp. I2]